jgi:hypothetical protein
MAHRIILNASKATIYVSHIDKAKICWIKSWNDCELYICDKEHIYKYEVREWLTANECRATLMEVS